MRGAAQVRSRRAKGGHKHTGGERETTVMDQRRGRGFHLFDRVFGEERVELSPLSDRLRTCRSWKRNTVSTLAVEQSRGVGFSPTYFEFSRDIWVL